MTDQRQLHVESDLTFSVTGPDGPVTGSVQAVGSDVTVHTSDPVSALRAALGTRRVRSRSFAGFGEVLGRSGVRVRVVGPTGPVITAGAGVDSRIGALLTGSTHVRVGSVRAAGPLLWARMSTEVARRPVVPWAVGAAVLSACAWWVRHRRA